MDSFDLLASTPPPGKRKVDELTPEKNDEEAHSTDVKDDVFEEERLRGPVLRKQLGKVYLRRQKVNAMHVEHRLKEWGLDKEFTVFAGSRLGCITCMKYDAWCEQEGADTKNKKRKGSAEPPL